MGPCLDGNLSPTMGILFSRVRTSPLVGLGDPADDAALEVPQGPRDLPSTCHADL